MALPPLSFDDQDHARIARVGQVLGERFRGNDERMAALFSGAPITRPQLDEALGAESVNDLIHLGLLEESDGRIRALFTARLVCGKVIFSDGRWHDRNLEPLFVDPLWEGHRIAELMVKSPARAGLDIGCGSGVLSLAMADYCEQVYGIDINPRALLLARFNAVLNGVHNVTFLESNLFAGLQGLTFDRMVFSSPVGEELAPRSLLESGEEILEAFFSQFPAHVSPNGVVQVNLCFRDWRGSTFFSRLERWLGRHRDDFQYVFLELWRRSGVGRHSGGPRILARYLRACFRAGVNPLRSKAISRGFLTLRQGREGHSWIIPSDYHAWTGDDIDGPTGDFLIAAITGLTPDERGGAVPSTDKLPGEAALMGASGQDLRARARLLAPRPV